MSCIDNPGGKAAEGEPRRASRDGQIPKDKVGVFRRSSCKRVARDSKGENRRRPLRAAADTGVRHLQEESAQKTNVSSR